MSPATTIIASLLFFSLLLLPHFGISDHISYTRGSSRLFLRSSDPPRTSTPAAAKCSSIPLALSKDKVPVVHRLSPCSPLNGAGKTSNPSPSEVLRRDARRIHALFATRSGMADAAAPGGVTLPTNGTTIPAAPGVQDYTVLVEYGTPAQPLPVVLDTSLGLSLLRCKPCISGAANCDPAFDTSRSSTFTHVPCGSPECRSNCSGSTTATCPLPPPIRRGTVVQDVLTLTPSAGVHDFTFGCVEVDHPSFRPFVGVLDLSRDSRSIASRLSPPGTPAFSYCLPLSTRSHGFLSIGANRPENPGDDRVKNAPLVPNPAFPNMYFIEVVGMSVGIVNLSIPATAATSTTTALDVITAFTYLKPSVYAPLRDEFRRQMSEYPVAPAFRGLDTCYNFTGLHEISIPLVGLKFGNGEELVLDTDQMFYYEDPSVGPFSVACLAFAALPSDNYPYSVIGTLTQTSTEVVYDVSGGKVGFTPWSC